MALAALLGLCGAAGCSSGCSSGAPSPSARDAGRRPALQRAADADADGFRLAVDLVDELPRCEVEHRGLLLDLGSNGPGASFGWQLRMPETILVANHDGASWARLYERKLSIPFFQSETGPIFVAMRAIGRDAQSAVLSIDGQALGTIKLAHDEDPDRVHRYNRAPSRCRPASAWRAATRRRLHGRRTLCRDRLAPRRNPRRPQAYLWRAHRGRSPVAHGRARRRPHRALSLRAPGTIRCALWMPEGARLRFAVGIRGAGAATVGVQIRRDGHRPTALQWIDIQGGPSAQWSDVDVPLAGHEGQIAALELVATKSSGTGRLLLGDPKIVVPSAPPVSTPAARAVAVVVLDGVERRELPPWRGTTTQHLPALTKLARTAVVFEDHRAPSSLVAATMASLLSGLSPRAHLLADPGARLPAAVPTLAAMARGASVRATMFTGVPTTFRAFGFGEGWDQFQEYPPNGGRLASAPLDDALSWLADSASPGGRGQTAACAACTLAVVIHLGSSRRPRPAPCHRPTTRATSGRAAPPRCSRTCATSERVSRTPISSASLRSTMRGSLGRTRPWASSSRSWKRPADGTRPSSS